MANSRKKISELPALNVASLDTTFVLGISGSTTYKISINNLTSSLDTTFATDLVTSALSSSLSGKLSTSSFNSYTQSFTASVASGTISGSSQLTSSYDTRYVISGSITQTTWDNIANKPAGIVSQSTDLSSLNTFTASISTASLVTSISNLNSATSSYLTSLSGAISSSSQLTSSYDTRYVLSGSITQTTWDNIASKPVGIVSGSVQVLGGSGVVSGSYETTGRGIISSSANLVTTSSYNADSASFDTRINSITVSSGSNLTYLLEAYANDTYTLPGGFTEDPCRYSVVSVNENVPSNWFNTSTYRFTPQKAGYWEINACYDVYRNSEASMAIRKNGSIVASAGSFNAVAQEVSKIIYLNGSTDYIDIVNTGGGALQRYQYQQRSWFQAKFVGNIDGSTDLPAGVISGSSQITAFGFVSGSYETTGRGIWSGSAQLPTGVVSGSAQTISNLPTGVISGSSQLTTSFPSKTTGTWSVPAGASTQSFSVESGASYTMWVNGNIPNGIITWNATVTTSNANVPVVGFQYGWYYTAGNQLVLTSMPDQITGTNGSIVNTPSTYAPNTSNVFKFGITNNSGTSQTINYGYIKLS